jgi:hypothetical protein
MDWIESMERGMFGMFYRVLGASASLFSCILPGSGNSVRVGSLRADFVSSAETAIEHAEKDQRFEALLEELDTEMPA